MVSLGANIRALDKKNMTALHYSATNLNYAATKVLLDSNAPVDIKNNDVRMMSLHVVHLTWDNDVRMMSLHVVHLTWDNDVRMMSLYVY